MAILVDSSGKRILGSVDILQNILSDAVVLSYKLRNFHWNITGLHFNDIHTFLGEEYDAVDATIDSVAERIRALRSNPISNLAGFLANTSLKEYIGFAQNPSMFLQEMLSDYEQIIAFITSHYGLFDKTTENFLQDIVAKMQKTAWKVRSMLA